MDYLTAKQTIGKLKQGRVTDISEAYFSQLVSMGAIPFHTIPGKKRKLYLYDEVKKALADIQDPSRDAQREANQKNRDAKNLITEQKKINADYQSAMQLKDLTDDELEERSKYKGSELEEAKTTLEEIRSANLVLEELVDEQKKLIQDLPLTIEVKTLITHKILKLTVEQMMTVDEFFDFI